MPSWSEQLTYPLRPENVACEPSEVRCGMRGLGRLLVVDRSSGAIAHSAVHDLPQWLSPGDVLVLNDCRRIPGVLHGRTPDGAQVELRFTHLEDQRRGVCRIYPTHSVEVGIRITFDNRVAAHVTHSGLPPQELWRVETDGPSLRDCLVEAGTPITSFFYSGLWKVENYNPCFAAGVEACESPMAGLHFTPAILEHLRASGIVVVAITLQPVGSWLPLKEHDGQFQLPQEPYFVPEATAQTIREARRRESRVIACGTTVVRTLESSALDDRTIRSGDGQAAISISPGYRFKVVDHYFTNFHPSSSSLMVLDAAFCDRQLLLKAYREASEAGYLFYEFGDAVFYR